MLSSIPNIVEVVFDALPALDPRCRGWLQTYPSQWPDEIGSLIEILDGDRVIAVDDLRGDLGLCNVVVVEAQRYSSCGVSRVLLR